VIYLAKIQKSNPDVDKLFINGSLHGRQNILFKANVFVLLSIISIIYIPKMKNISFKKWILMVGLLPLTFVESNAQGTSLQDFSLKLSPGAMVYYGDLTNASANAFDKISGSSRLGFGCAVIRQYSPFFGLQAQVTAGNLHKTSDDGTYFSGSLTEFGLSARFDPIKLWKKRTCLLSPYVSVGVGAFIFKSAHRVTATDSILLPTYGYNFSNVDNSSKQTALCMPIAIGLSYSILPNLQLELEHSIRMTNTDLLDCVKGTSATNDSYSTTSIGLRISIPSKSTGKTTNNTLINSSVTNNQKNNAINIFIDCETPETVDGGKTFNVDIRVNKGSYKGQGKLIQRFPEGFTAIENMTETLPFTFTNQTVVVEWEKLPADTTVTYSYRVKVAESVSGNQTITGRFEYMESDGVKTVRFNKSIFVNNQSLQDQNNAKESDAATTYTKSNIKKSQAVAGIEYRIQIGAFRNNSQADTQLAAKYKISELIQEEFVDGWYKYTVGSFRTYEDAASYKDKFIAKTKLLSVFIVAYKDGRRLAKISDATK